LAQTRKVSQHKFVFGLCLSIKTRDHQDFSACKKLFTLDILLANNDLKLFKEVAALKGLAS